MERTPDFSLTPQARLFGNAFAFSWRTDAVEFADGSRLRFDFERAAAVNVTSDGTTDYGEIDR